MTTREDHWRSLFLAAYTNHTGDARRLALNDAWFAYASSDDYYKLGIESLQPYWTALVDAAHVERGQPRPEKTFPGGYIPLKGTHRSLATRPIRTQVLERVKPYYEAELPKEESRLTLTEWAALNRQDPDKALAYLTTPEVRSTLVTASAQLGKRGAMVSQIVRALCGETDLTKLPGDEED